MQHDTICNFLNEYKHKYKGSTCRKWLSIVLDGNS